MVEDSSGNGGLTDIAMEEIFTGISVNIVTPSNASAPKISQIKAYGAKVHLVPGGRERKLSKRL